MLEHVTCNTIAQVSVSCNNMKAKRFVPRTSPSIATPADVTAFVLINTHKVNVRRRVAADMDDSDAPKRIRLQR